MSTTWLADAAQQSFTAQIRLESSRSTLELRLNEVGMRVRKELQRLGDTQHDFDRRLELSIDHDRVLGLVREGRSSDLTGREARYAARLLGLVTPMQFATLIAERPRCAAELARQCFRAWSQFETLRDRGLHATLLASHSGAIPALNANLVPLEALLSPEGPARVAEQLQDASIDSFLPLLEERARLDPRWEFSSFALAAWFEVRRVRGEHITEACKVAMQDGTLSAVLIPARKDDKSGSRPAPVRHRTCARVHTGFVATAIDAAFQTPRLLDDGVLDALVENLLQSSFGDPLVFPESSSWKSVRESSAYYEAFLSSLIRDDLEFFFEQAMNEPARARFWLKYLPQIRRTTCILAWSHYDRVRRQLQAGDQRRRGALQRLQRFRTGGEDTHAFCITFDDIVVVEFSQTSHAAYVYERKAFEQELEQRIRHPGLNDVGKLKNQRLMLTRIVHRKGWEDEAAETLRIQGVARPGQQTRGGKETGAVFVQGYKKFHRRACKALDWRSGPTEYRDRKTALEAGFLPCGRCAP